MKIDAKLELSDAKSKDCTQTYVKVPVDTDYVEGNEEAVNEWIANELEEEFKHFIGTPFAIATLSGTAAFHLCLFAMDIKRGDKIICSVTCLALLAVHERIRESA